MEAKEIGRESDWQQTVQTELLYHETMYNHRFLVVSEDGPGVTFRKGMIVVADPDGVLYAEAPRFLLLEPEGGVSSVVTLDAVYNYSSRQIEVLMENRDRAELFVIGVSDLFNSGKFAYLPELEIVGTEEEEVHVDADIPMEA